MSATSGLVGSAPPYGRSCPNKPLPRPPPLKAVRSLLVRCRLSRPLCLFLAVVPASRLGRVPARRLGRRVPARRLERRVPARRLERVHPQTAGEGAILLPGEDSPDPQPHIIMTISHSYLHEIVIII